MIDDRSPHQFARRDEVQRLADNLVGAVREHTRLRAVIEWEGGTTEEVEQFDPRIVVVHRTAPWNLAPGGDYEDDEDWD